MVAFGGRSVGDGQFDAIGHEFGGAQRGGAEAEHGGIIPAQSHFYIFGQVSARNDHCAFVCGIHFGFQAEAARLQAQGRVGGRRGFERTEVGEVVFFRFFPFFHCEGRVWPEAWQAAEGYIFKDFIVFFRDAHHVDECLSFEKADGIVSVHGCDGGGFQLRQVC